MAEIPSGMAADLLGRKRTLALSGVMAAVSGALMGFERGFGFVMASMACSALSYNLISGTLQALTYDSLCEEKRTDLYPAVQARCAWLESAGALLGRLAGGLTAVLSFTRFYLVDVGLSFLRSAAALTLREPTVTEAQAARQAADVRTLLRSLPRRLREHVRATVHFLLHSPAVARLLLANALILAVVFFTVRSCIGLGTLVNMVCVGYIADFICWLVQEALTLTLGIPVRILLLPAALLFASSGVAL